MPVSRARHSEMPGDDEASEIKARSWEETDAAIDAEMREANRAYWNDPERWAALSEVSRETLQRTMGR